MLEELVMNDGDWYVKSTDRLIYGELSPLGAPIAIIVQSICDPRDTIKEMVKNSTTPPGATAFTVSDFNPNTKIIKDGKEWCARAVQFYAHSYII